MAVIFSDTIKNLRLSRRLSQTELAKQLGVTRSMISAYESGIRSPSHETLVRIAHEFDVSMDYLYDFKRGQRARETVDVTGLEKRHRILVEDLVEAIRGGNS